MNNRDRAVTRHTPLAGAVLALWTMAPGFSQADIVCPGSALNNGILTIENISYQAGDQVDCLAADTITLGDAVVVPDLAGQEGMEFNLIAPRVAFNGVFRVPNNSRLRVISPRPLNDTGIVDCADVDNNGLACPVADYPGQDAAFGRDVSHNDDTDGHAGFSFTKVCNSGELAGKGSCPPDPVLGAGANDWACNQDNVTGLIWEVKTVDKGLRDRGNTYTWYDIDGQTNGGGSGVPNGGYCQVGDCDTSGYIEEINAQGLCGAKDWRMPDRVELRTIASLDRLDPAIDTDFFPNSRPNSYWTGDADAETTTSAWYVGFDFTTVGAGHKRSRFYSVRAVRRDR